MSSSSDDVNVAISFCSPTAFGTISTVVFTKPLGLTSECCKTKLLAKPGPAILNLQFVNVFFRGLTNRRVTRVGTFAGTSESI